MTPGHKEKSLGILDVPGWLQTQAVRPPITHEQQRVITWGGHVEGEAEAKHPQ